MSGLRVSIGDILADQREVAAARLGASAEDMRIARASGFDPQDVMTIRQITAARAVLLIFRCPNLAARSLHGLLPAKTAVTTAKSGSSGAVTGARGLLMVSDYDIMSCWRQDGAGLRKIPITAAAPGAKFGAWLPEARDLVRELNRGLVTKIQHGAQDDWLDADRNRGVKAEDLYLAFRLGVPVLQEGPAALERFYKQDRLFWPYLPNGRHCGRTA
ncbi:hypothetical protein [Falsiroseomonas sp.]|uniref:hypothetical protein n=1 Tax=Falsiroseomonas sp. TaxID=2870721 RepID=UPI002726F74C|nr:hypothetical protein [Falsiroseomonas sp.]MDO9503275.1 hypothetical protein [Falsiroseomonas sp.]